MAVEMARAVRVLLLLTIGAQAKILFTKEPYSQDALHGRSAILRCEVEQPSDIEFEWLQNGVPVQDTERRFKEGSSLQITSVDRQQDSGNFQCVARNVLTGEEARTTNVSFNIKWIETGEVVLRTPATMEDIQSSTLVTLRCHIDGHPRPTSQWFRDGTLIVNDHNNYSVISKERTLILRSAVPDDNGVYYCCARNTVGSVCSSNNFTLNIIDESFPHPVIVPENQIVNKNEEAMFHCQFTAVPPPTQEWLFDGKIISNMSRTVVLSNGSLLIPQVKPRNVGVYKCVGHGQRGNPVILEATLQLAEIHDMVSLEPKTFIDNTEQRVVCYAPRGVPRPHIWWERNGFWVPTTGRVRQEAEELIFESIVETDAGIYTCHAANKAGEKKQDQIITVATKPTWVIKPKDVQLEEGKPAYLHCLSKASMKPTISWYRNGIPISEDSRFDIAENGTLRINNVDVYDGTTYKCVSSTLAGSIQAQVRVQVLENLKFTPPPQPQRCVEFDKEVTVSCSATGLEQPTIRWIKSVFVSFKVKPTDTTVYQGHTAMFQCQAEGDPVPQIQWKGKNRILEPDKVLPRIQIMSNGSLIIYDVTTEDSGKYTCIAGNSCNIKDHDASLYVVEKPIAAQDDTSNNHTPYKMIQTIGLSVGAAVAYIIIVLGLMFYCKKRRKAKRLKKQPEGEEPEMECLNGGTLLQNGQTTAEIQEEVALTNLGSSSSASKRHSASDKMHFPRSNLQTITTLGKGEFGEVFLAKAKGIEEDSETEVLVLVKSLQTRDEQLQLDFRREFEMFGKLNHSNVVRLLGLCRETEPHYMILEYVDLGDLKQFLRISRTKDEKLKPQPISTKQKVSFSCQVALGMEHLSNSRFVHKDLAARNCLVSAQRQVKVSSLSLSKDVYNSEYYHYHQAWIPLRWMPPEAVLEDEFSTKSDVWSFGVVMWEIFTLGEMPHSKLADEEVLAGLQNGKMKLPHPEGCPSKVYKVMQRCWATSPKDRPSFSEIANMLGESPSESKA
ncbi:inactive tyrosine-protein kinase 7 isoform X2 [Heteronotia binoei]|uniref:inactive tyrosine-protein kinase 7 isoform X2 n=1 Tax=Heteronotia binoei TaxID=13085 RepID=UPI00292F5C06|nr:inactive tyrosine-protein kinase 7 isoform X2 [Heteronotia binoei]